MPKQPNPICTRFVVYIFESTENITRKYLILPQTRPFWLNSLWRLPRERSNVEFACCLKISKILPWDEIHEILLWRLTVWRAFTLIAAYRILFDSASLFIDLFLFKHRKTLKATNRSLIQRDQSFPRHMSYLRIYTPAYCTQLWSLINQTLGNLRGCEADWTEITRLLRYGGRSVPLCVGGFNTIICYTVYILLRQKSDATNVSALDEETVF